MNFLLFQIYPYIALTVLALGCIARYERDPFTWKSSSSQLLRRKQLILGSVLFHVGVLIIFFGHLAGLLTPLWFFELVGISHGFKQVLAIIVGGVGGDLRADRRRHAPAPPADRPAHPRDVELRRHRHPGAAADQLVLGVLTIIVSLQHLDGGEMVNFMTWSQGIFTFRTDAWENVADANILFKLHIFLGLTIFLLFPFTRLVHMLSVPVRYLWRPGYQIVRTRRRIPPEAARRPVPCRVAAHEDAAPARRRGQRRDDFRRGHRRRSPEPPRAPGKARARLARGGPGAGRAGAAPAGGAAPRASRPSPERLGAGRRETDDEALIRAVIEHHVAPAPPDEAACRAALCAPPRTFPRAEPLRRGAHPAARGA